MLPARIWLVAQLLVLAVLSAGFAAHPSVPMAAWPEPALSPTPAAIHLVFWENLPPAQAEALLAEADAFDQQASELTLEIRHYRDTAQLLRTLSGPSAQAWQLALGDASLAANLHAQGALEPLDVHFSNAFLESFVEPTLTGVRGEGHVWGLPDTAGMHLLLFYNRAFVDTPPSDTWQLFQLAGRLTRGDQWGLVLNSYDPIWVIPWLAGYGGWLTDEQGRPTLDSPAMVQALNLYLSWHARLTGVAPTVTYAEARRLFTQGKAAMLIDGEWAMVELDQVRTLNWGVAPLPKVSESGLPAAPLVMARYWLVRRDLPAYQLQAIQRWLSFVCGPERQLDWARRFGLLPTRRLAIGDPRLVHDTRLGVSASQLQAGRSLLMGVDANYLLDAMRGPLRWLLAGAMSPEDATHAMQAALSGS